MGRPRITVKGATTATTRRTTQRKFFLGPWAPEVQDIWLYALADAQRNTGVAIHATSLMPSHHHTAATPSDDDSLPEFWRRAHLDTSCALNTLLLRDGYDAPGELFDDRQPHYLRLVDPAAQMANLIYTAVQAPQAGLVERPEDMPGWTFDFGLWRTRLIKVRKPKLYFAKSRPEILHLELTPPPLLYQAFHGDLDKLIYRMKQLTEEAIRAIHHARTRPVLGPQALQQLHPYDEPRTRRETRGQRIPTFQIGARGAEGAILYQRCVDEKRAFEAQHQQARETLRDGDHHNALFPYGTYQWRLVHGANVDLPSEAAILAAPGPTLREVQQQLQTQHHTKPTDTHDLLQEVRDALQEEAPARVEEHHLDLRPHSASSHFNLGGIRADTDADDANQIPDPEDGSDARQVPDPEDGSDARQVPEPEDQDDCEALTRHRFDPKPRQRPDAPRIITLRDNFRRLQKRNTGRGGNDPPTT